MELRCLAYRKLLHVSAMSLTAESLTYPRSLIHNCRYEEYAGHITRLSEHSLLLRLYAHTKSRLLYAYY